MTTDFEPGDRVYAGDTLAYFVKYVYRGDDSHVSAIIKVGEDTRLVSPVSLRKAV